MGKPMFSNTRAAKCSFAARAASRISRKPAKYLKKIDEAEARLKSRID